MFNAYRIGENAGKRLLRYCSTNSKNLGNDKVNPFVYNRNPRNLEKLTIAYKTAGYHLDKPGREFWHKLVLKQRVRFVTASVIHNTERVVVEASTNECAIREYLPGSSTDTSAYINIGRVIAQRCLESGITEVYCDIEATPGTKVALFLEEVKNHGLWLEEAPRYKPVHLASNNRPVKPWEVME